MIGTKKLGVASRSAASRFGCKALAVALAAALAAPMTGAPVAGQAWADEGDNATETTQPETGTTTESNTNDSPLKVRGIDFMQPGAEGAWELLRVDNGAGETLYIDVEENGTPIVKNFAYDVPEGNVDEDVLWAGNNASAKLAQVVELDMTQTITDEDGTTTADYKLSDTFKDPTSFPVFTITVKDAKRAGATLYTGQVYPVYAKLVGLDDSEEYKFLGIRTMGEKDAFANTVGAGANYYKVNGADRVIYTADIVSASQNPVAINEGNKLVVRYSEVPEGAISGAVKYVDVDGNVVRTDLIEDIGDGKTVEIERSFFVTQPKKDEDGNVQKDEKGNELSEAAYYRVIDRLTGSTVDLDPTQATKQVRVIRVDDISAAGAYQVTIEYVDRQGELLWTDYVDVKGEGYQYTLPTLFSISANNNIVDADGNSKDVNSNREKDQWGVRQYSLAGYSYTLDVNKKDEAIDWKPVEGLEGIEANPFGSELTNDELLEQIGDVDPVISFVPDGEGDRTYRATYLSQEETGEATLVIREINGETGELIATITKTLKPRDEQPVTYTPAKKDNGLVPWSGNTEPITYSWDDLAKGTDLVQYVYYVPEDYVPGDAYDVTVQYMNIANSQILRTETVSIDPEITDFVEIIGEERFTDGTNEYVRLAGQETAIRHAYLSPTRTYTIYYRDVNDVLNANTTVRRTQIVNTIQDVAAPAAPATAAAAVPAAPAGAAAGGAAPVPAGVTTGDATTVINDDENPLANLNGQDTATERTIADNETPMASGADLGAGEVDSGGMAIAAVLGIIVLAAVGAAFVVMSRKRKEQETATDEIEA